MGVLAATTTHLQKVLDGLEATGVQIVPWCDVPDPGPSNKGVWYQIEDVSSVFVDMKRSTELNIATRAKTAAQTYSFFVNGMANVAERFGAKYIDVQGDALFALYSGTDSVFHALAAAISMRSLTETLVAPRLKKASGSQWTLEASIGIDRKSVLVRRLGLRGTKQNEVWAGKPVNMSAKLRGLAEANEIVCSTRVFDAILAGNEVRRRALLYSCGCGGAVTGDGLDAPLGTTSYLWEEIDVSTLPHFDFPTAHRLRTKWCSLHGSDFCEAIYYGKL